MLEPLWRRYRTIRRRARRFTRREAHAFRRWLEDTENFLHLSTLLVVPLVIGAITWISNASAVVSFLIYPPLASGTYALFTDPSGPYADPITFVGGITVGAVSGLVALRFSATFLTLTQPGYFEVYAGTAALGIFLTTVLTWGLDLEVPTAFSTTLLVLVTGSSELTYVIGIVVSSVIVAAVFSAWRRYFYRERSQYLFRSTSADDHVLVPTRADTPASIGLFAARLAAAHESGKVLLMETVEKQTITETEATLVAEAEAEAEAEAKAEAEAEAEAKTETETKDKTTTATVGRPTPDNATASTPATGEETPASDDTASETDHPADITETAEQQVTAHALQRLETRHNAITRSNRMAAGVSHDPNPE